MPRDQSESQAETWNVHAPFDRTYADLLSFAEQLRKNATPSEIDLLVAFDSAGWSVSVKFQEVLLGYIVDFLIPDWGIVVEVDGFSHVGRQRQDSARDKWVCQHGLRILHVPDHKVRKHAAGIVAMVAEFAAAAPERGIACDIRIHSGIAASLNPAGKRGRRSSPPG